MNQSLEWRLARTFVRCYSLVLLISFTQAIIGPMFGFWMPGYTTSGVIWDRSIVPTLGIWLATISTLGVWLASIVILWFYSNRIADKLAGTHDSAIKGEQLDFPFDVGVGLAGLIFLVEGLKNLAGVAVAWYFVEPDTFVAYHPPGVVDIRHLAGYSAEAILGLVLFVGAKSIMKGIMKLRGMPPSTDEDEAV
jgi:hypothetical protein